MTISFAVLGLVVVLFRWNRVPVELVAVGADPLRDRRLRVLVPLGQLAMFALVATFVVPLIWPF